LISPPDRATPVSPLVKQSTNPSADPSGDDRMIDDDELMVKVQEMQTWAFNALVQRYQGALFGFFYANTRDRQLAEDLTQDTLLKVYDQAWDYLPSGRFRGWLFRLARNHLIDTIRRQRRDALIRAVGPDSEDDDPLASVVSGVESPEDEADQHELSRIVDKLLAELPEEQRLTFTLHHFSEMPLPEVAHVLETSTSTTKSRLRLAREKLRERLADLGIQGALPENHHDD
jgi:RNA polymerase sigma-70 factor (ECF subfamily)